MRQVRHITLRKRIEIDGQKRDRLTVGHRERSTQRWLVPDCQEHVDLARRELAIVLFVAFDIRCLDVIECKIPTFLIAEFGHPLEEICIKWGLSRQHTNKADAHYLRLELRARRERPRGRCAAQQRDELAPLHRCNHSITSSARARSVDGTSRPSALAVLRLITSSNLVGAWIGRSPGFSPLRMRST